MRVDHPLVGRDMTLKDFLAYDHLRLYLHGLSRENTSMVDDVLGQYGVHRKICLETTQFASAVGVLACTDALLVANALMRHTRTSRSAPHQWMRTLLMHHLTKSDSKVDDADTVHA
jgi:hypothetical protein